MGERIEYKIETRAIYVKEVFKDVYVSGIGANTKYEPHSLGWFLFLTGSYEAINLGKEKPQLEANDEIEIIIRKKQHG